MENTQKNSDQPLKNNTTKPRLSIQQRWGKAAEEGALAGGKLTGEQALAQARLNSGYVAKAIHSLPKPGLKQRKIIIGPTPRP